jgi:calcineurin-like phosphoesterase family protein
MDMSEVFFIADTHFNHERILGIREKEPGRKFASTEEHDEELVRRWNATVGKKDAVWHLGDFSFGKRGLQVAARLNGKKSLVLGNNDRYESKDYLRYFGQIAGIVEMKDFALSHVPLHESQLKRWHFNVHGHLHSRTVKRLRHRDEPKAVKHVDDLRFLCVSCEQVNLTPVSYDWILGKLGIADK